MLIEKYINPFTDFGFKRIFGEENQKELLLDFLNELLRDEEGGIKSITYLKADQLGKGAIDRRAVFDIYCENERGEKFIVELQKTKQKFFKDRSLYYSTFPIRKQAQRANWNFELKAVYLMAILDFVFDDNKEQKNKYFYKVKLSDIETNKVFYNKLTFIYLEMPKFTKTLDEIETRFEKWLYVIRNLNQFDNIPDKLRERIFERLFEAAEIAKFSPDQFDSYEDSLKIFRDLNNPFDTATEDGFNKGMKEGLKQGIQQGIEQGKYEAMQSAAKKMKQEGLSIALIARLTGLTEDDILSLKRLND